MSEVCLFILKRMSSTYEGPALKVGPRGGIVHLLFLSLGREIAAPGQYGGEEQQGPVSQDREAGRGAGLPSILPRLPLPRKRDQWVMNKSKC